MTVQSPHQNSIRASSARAGDNDNTIISSATSSSCPTAPTSLGSFPHGGLGEWISSQPSSSTISNYSHHHRHPSLQLQDEDNDFIRGGFTATFAAAAGNDSNASDDEDSIQGDIARLTRSITYLQQDLESADYSFLDDFYNDELTDHPLNRCWNDKLMGLKMWLSRSSIVEQKLLHAFAPTPRPDLIDGRDSDNPLLFFSLSLKLTLLVVMVLLMLLKISSFVDGGSNIDHQGQLADIVGWWLFQR